MTIPTEPTTADWLAHRIDVHLHDYLWNGPRIAIDGHPYDLVDPDEVPGMDEFDVVLRGPDGTLYDVDLAVTVTPRPTP
jgi:hypothetical protein